MLLHGLLNPIIAHYHFSIRLSNEVKMSDHNMFARYMYPTPSLRTRTTPTAGQPGRLASDRPIYRPFRLLHLRDYFDRSSFQPITCLRVLTEKTPHKRHNHAAVPWHAIERMRRAKRGDGGIPRTAVQPSIHYATFVHTNYQRSL